MAKQITIILILGLLLIAACSPTNQTDGTPPVVTGEPTLSISGDELDDTSVLDSSTSFDDVDSVDTDMNITEPSLDDSDIPIKRVREGDLVKFNNLKATDADGDTLTFTFVNPLNSDGEWQTKRGDAGEYKTTITVTDDKSSATQDILIIVESVNKAPVLTVSEIITVNEGDVVNINPQATDANGDDVTISLSGWITEDKKETDSEDIGEHTVIITANDGFSTTTKEITIIVKDVNYGPKLDLIDDIELIAGEKVVIDAKATDADQDTLEFTFSEPLNKDGEWQTEEGEEGSYTVQITVSDGRLNDSTSIDIIVLKLNHPPILSLEKTSITVNEGETVAIGYAISDSDGDDVTVEFTGWMTSDSYTTNFQDAGTYEVTITANDGTETISQEVAITVIDKNQPPVFDKDSFI